MDPKDRKPEMNPGNNWEQDLEAVRSALPGLESVEPPDLLDQVVLNTARRELAASRRKPMRWIGALATAAVLVLTLSIVLQQDQKTPDPRNGNGIKLDAARPAAASNVASTPPLEMDYAAKKTMQQVGKESGYRPVNEPDLAKRRTHFEDESPDLQSVLSRDTAKQARVVQEEQTGDAILRIDLSALQTKEEVSEAVLPDPVAWIEKMLELQQTERHEELKYELEAFRKVYPAYPLPSELRD